MKNMPVLLLLLLVVSCKKEADSDPMPTAAPLPPAHPYSITDFFKQTPGDYWLFEIYRYDSNGVYISGPALDSIFVSGDTIINGSTYAVFKRGNPATGNVMLWQCLRDSADCIVNSHGLINFRFGVFDQVAWSDFQPGIVRFDFTLNSTPLQHSFPAGSFLTYLVTSTGQILAPGLPQVPASRWPFTYWSPGVGRVMHMTSYVSSGWIEMHQLLRYRVL